MQQGVTEASRLLGMLGRQNGGLHMQSKTLSKNLCHKKMLSESLTIPLNQPWTANLLAGSYGGPHGAKIREFNIHVGCLKFF